MFENKIKKKKHLKKWIFQNIFFLYLNFNFILALKINIKFIIILQIWIQLFFFFFLLKHKLHFHILLVTIKYKICLGIYFKILQLRYFRIKIYLKIFMNRIESFNLTPHLKYMKMLKQTLFYRWPNLFTKPHDFTLTSHKFHFVTKYF